MESTPSAGFSLAISAKMNRSASNSLACNFYYRDILWAKMKFKAYPKGHVVTLFLEALCFKTYLSLYLHRILKFYFFLFRSIWHLYLVLIRVCGGKMGTLGVKWVEYFSVKENLRSKKKLSSYERTWKMQKDEPSPTSMRPVVLEIFHFKVRNLSNMDVAIF